MGNTLEILPKTVRELLKIDNEGILSLCKAANIPLRQNEKGLTYFTTEDVKTLKKLQDIQKKAKVQEEKFLQLKNKLKKLPALNKSSDVQTKTNEETLTLLKQITGAVKNIENGIYDKFANLLDTKLENKLEEKLGGIDEVIMDLVRSKVEADELRKQIAENDKEIFALKNQLASFKKVAGNLYIKKSPESDSPFNV